MNKTDITFGMIRNMQHCIGFDKNKVTGTKHRVMRAYRNYYCTHESHKDWNMLIAFGLAKRSADVSAEGVTYFRLTLEGFKFLADLCGFEKIIEID